MALRARLSAPRAERDDWPWHRPKWSGLRASLVFGGDRRLEAENYLTSGYGIRLAIETRKTGWTSLKDLARVWQPSRLKGIQVGAEFGTPFLAATQVFDLRPIPRKFLSLDRTDSAADRFVSSGMILVTCSGSVGRATLAHAPHEKILISHDLLRVEPRQKELWGWLYAYLRAPQTRAMMTTAQYGHIIKHLEVAHLDALPIPILHDSVLDRFNANVRTILRLRLRSYELTVTAENQYAAHFPATAKADDKVVGYSVLASEAFRARRRLDAGCYTPSAKSTVTAFRKHALDVVPLLSVAPRIFVPGRFKHIYGDGGTPYLDSADLLEVSPDIKKRVLSLNPLEQEEYKVEAGWVLIPCSGQTYGNIGHAILSTSWHTEKVLSNHILRVCPGRGVRSGYLQCVLGHPELGRPQTVRLAFGSSVPEIAAEDIATLEIPRLDPSAESDIADLVEEAAQARARADDAEEKIAIEAEQVMDAFVSGLTRIA
jgi:hypothetical protein